jgi:FkbM family methyltransferase
VLGLISRWKRLLRLRSAKKLCVVNGIGMYLDVNEHIQGLMAKGQYEPTQTQWVKRHLRLGNVFADVGSNFGHYTTLARSLVGPGGKVFAFDPSPVAFAALKEAIDRANLSNVTLVNAAVGKENGELTIYMPPAGANVHSPSAFESHPNCSPISVPLIALDSYAPFLDCPTIDMVKIDVEGSEPDVLDGMRKLIADGRVKRIICEFNSWWLRANNTTVEELFLKFEACNFEVEDKTEWQRNLPAIGNETFDLQDVLFRHTSASNR